MQNIQKLNMRGPRKRMIQQHNYIWVSNSSNHPLLCISKIEDIKWKKKLQKYFHRPNCVSCGVQFWGPARKRREKSRCCLSQWFQMTKNSPKIRLQNSWNCLIILVQASFWWIMLVKGIQSPETEIMGLNQLQVGWKIVKSSELIFGGF